MIKNSEPLNMVEVEEYIQKDGSETDIASFINKFDKLKIKDARELKQELEGFGMMKIRAESIVKIIDLLPGDSEELNKIFIDVVLTEDETKKILDTIKKYK